MWLTRKVGTFQCRFVIAALSQLAGNAIADPPGECCIPCSDNLTNYASGYCWICPPDEGECLDGLLDWFHRVASECWETPEVEPWEVDPWLLAQMVCSYTAICGGDCEDVRNNFGSLLEHWPLTEEEKFMLDQACGCGHEPPPPPPPWGSNPMPVYPSTFEDGSGHGPCMSGPLCPTPRNPFEPNWGGGGPIDLGTGGYSPTEIDLSLPAPGFRWNIGRSYCAVQSDGGTHFDSNTAQGWNWTQISQPEIRRSDLSTGIEFPSIVYLINSTSTYTAFSLKIGSVDTFEAIGGASGIVLFEEDGSGIDTYTYFNQNGSQSIFFGFELAAGDAAGKLWKIIDTAGNVAYVGHPSNKATAASTGYTDNGDIEKAFDSSGREFHYTYSGSAIGGAIRLVSVDAGRYDGMTWVSEGMVQYDYCLDDFSHHGLAGDLKLVTITTPGSEDDGTVLRQKHYRYWKDSMGDGHAHAIKYEVDYEGARQADLVGNGDLDGSFASESTSSPDNYMSDNDLRPFAKGYFEYNSDHQLAEVWFDGECGCSGGVNGTRTYSYEVNGSYSEGPGYESAWKNRTLIIRPDNTYEIHYFDGWGQPLSTIITAGNPSSTDAWVSQIVRDADGFVVETRTPANCSGYTHASGVIGNDTAVGLITVFERFDALGGSSTDDFKNGFIEYTKWKVGTSGTEHYVGKVEYESVTASIGDSGIERPLISARTEYPTQTDTDTGGITTETDYEFHTASGAELMPSVVTVTHPAVSSGNNGSDAEVETETYLNTDGTLAFVKSAIATGMTYAGERYTIDYYEYTRGLVTKHIQDANTDLDGSGEDFEFVTMPGGLASWSDSPDVPLHIVTTYTHDAQGRSLTTTLPRASDDRVVQNHYTALADGRMVTLGVPMYVAGSPDTFYGPVSYSVRNHAGVSELAGTIAIASSTTALSGWIDEAETDPIDALLVGTLERMSTSLYTSTGGKLKESRQYYNIATPAYDSTGYVYDEMGRLLRVEDPTGTINRSVFDAMGRVYERWVGTDDTGDPLSGMSGTNNMVKVEAREFDGTGVGNSYLTKVTRFVESTTTGQRVTAFTNDSRGRAILVTNPVAPHVLNLYDNLGRVTATGLYSSTGSLTTSSDPTSTTSGRLALSQSLFDERGQVWKTIRHKINASTGASDDTLDALNWYSHRGELIKTDAEQLMKYRYDRLGRQTNSFTLAVVGGDTAYADADDVNGDQVIEEHQSVYQDPDAHAVMTIAILRSHDDYGLTESTAELDTNADGDPLVVTASNLKGRVQISSTWYDDLDRPVATAVLGTARLNESGGPSTYNRSAATSPPSRSDTELVTTTVYADDGAVDTVTDPMNRVTRYEYDDAGRQTKVINNFIDGTPSADTDQTILYAYTNGLLTSMTADLPDTPSVEPNQVTTYVYGVTSSDTPGSSKFASNRLLRKVVYPDVETGEGDADHTVYYAYNVQGEPIYTKDQAGNVIDTVYDDGGRELHREVTTLASGFDGAIRRISTAYDNLGRTDTVTQYDNASSATDQVQFAYDGWGNTIDFTQDVDGVIGAGGRAAFGITHVYAKNTSGRNTIRKTSTTLPGSVAMNFDYISHADSIGDDNPLSRVTRVKIGTTTVAQYKYLGAETVIGTTYPVINVFSRRYGSSSSSYPDFMDRFGRMNVNTWTKDLSTDVNFYEVEIRHDRNSNITSIDDQVQTGFDYGLTNDGLNRLTTAEQGTWTGSAISSRTRNETWALTQTGNWKDYYRDLNGDNNYTDSGEFRAIGAFNDVNEQSQRGLDTTGDGTADTTETLTYDKVGNMTDNGESHTFVYDVFGRLRFVKTRGGSPTVVSEHRYNGLGYRIGWHYDVTDDGTTGEPDGVVDDDDDPWYYFTYDDRWRIVATFRGSDSNVKERFFHHNAGLGGAGGASYIDSLILRDRDANTVWASAADSTAEERVYFCQNWRADVVSLLKNATGGSVEQLEGVRYTAYGVPFGLPKGDVNSDGVCDFNDYSEVATWHGTSAYDARGDIDLDGDLDTADETAVYSANGSELGLGQLSLEPDSSVARVGNRIGYAGYIHEVASSLDHIRHRGYEAERGRWTRRDPLGYVDSSNLYLYASASPIRFTDPYGLKSQPCIGDECYRPFGPSRPPEHMSPGEIDCFRQYDDEVNKLHLEILEWQRQCQSPAPGDPKTGLALGCVLEAERKRIAGERAAHERLETCLGKVRGFGPVPWDGEPGSPCRPPPMELVLPGDAGMFPIKSELGGPEDPCGCSAQWRRNMERCRTSKVPAECRNFGTDCRKAAFAQSDRCHDKCYSKLLKRDTVFPRTK